MKKVFLTTFLLITIYLLPTPTNAQTFLGTGTLTNRLASELVVNVNPNYPKPYQTVYLSIEMYTEKLDSADISYYVNGSLISKGKGLKNFSFSMGGVGATTNIKIAVSLQNGSSFSKELTLVAASVDLVVEADSYVPPFYKGKASYAQQSMVKIVAMPYFGPSISSTNKGSNLIYNWSVDGEVQQGLSGYGKNIANIRGDLLGTQTLVEVEVMDPITNVTTKGRVSLIPNDPNILFYEDSPLYGLILEHAILGNLNMLNDETNVVAVPYNISRSSLSRNKYEWRINGQSAPSIIGREAIFRRPDSTGGESLVSLEITNPREYLQYSKNSFVIKFDKANAINQ